MKKTYRGFELACQRELVLSGERLVTASAMRISDGEYVVDDVWPSMKTVWAGMTDLMLIVDMAIAGEMK